MRRLEQAMRAVDVVAGGAALLVAAPLLALLGALVKATSPGPALFAQERVGRGGRPFRLWKLRTMVDGAEQLGPRLTGRADPRVTRLGRFLRRTKLDELPQLWNVVRGEMALVGPRPEVAEMVRRAPAAYGALLRVRPGLVSPASLAWRYEEDLLPERGREEHYLAEILPRKIELDLGWLERRSLIGDLELLLPEDRDRGSAFEPERGHALLVEHEVDGLGRQLVVERRQLLHQPAHLFGDRVG